MNMKTTMLFDPNSPNTNISFFNFAENFLMTSLLINIYNI